jgi:hypothetical protein
MSTSTTVRPRFTFGIEIEILVKPKKGTRVYKDMLKHHFDQALQPAKGVDEDKKERNRTAIRLALAENLTDSAGIPAKIEGSGYDTWYIKKEGSLDEVVDARGGGGYCKSGSQKTRHKHWFQQHRLTCRSIGAIELVSHIFESDDPLWAAEVHDIFEFVWDNFDVLLTRGCSMHVHVAPKPDWTVLPLRNIMKATGVFDDAIMKIMPAVRKENPWARSNFRDGPRDNPLGEDKATPGLKNAFDEVPSRAWRPLFALFDKIKMVNAALLTWGQSRNVSWNLASLQKCGTVEFRRPPGVDTPADAQKWAAFTVAFACAATQTDWHTPWLSNNRHATVAELRAFVSRGLKLLGWERFLDPRVLTEITDPAMPFTAFDLEEVKRKLAKANRASGIEEKVGLVLNAPRYPHRRLCLDAGYSLFQLLTSSLLVTRSSCHDKTARQAAVLRAQRLARQTANQAAQQAVVPAAQQAVAPAAPRVVVPAAPRVVVPAAPRVVVPAAPCARVLILRQTVAPILRNPPPEKLRQEAWIDTRKDVVS